MNEKIAQLIKSLDEYIDNPTNPDQLTQITLDIIADDQFELLTEEIQDKIYELDNQDLNNLSFDDLKQIRFTLSGFGLPK